MRVAPEEPFSGLPEAISCTSRGKSSGPPGVGNAHASSSRKSPAISWIRQGREVCALFGSLIRGGYTWRRGHVEIVRGWYPLNEMIPAIADGRKLAIDPKGLLWTSKEGIVLPSGRIIRYPDLRQEVNPYSGRTEWVYAHGRHKAKLYGGKADENCVQALARDVIADYTLDFYKATRLTPALMVHDELVYVVPDADAQPLLDTLQAIMRTPPTWWPELITWSEGDIADSYGAAK